ncbi:MaoC family dehydratase [Glycomyces sp. NRRL B-16210]|uniref:MaoC family dehydratase n=1 Tax=Glycomyces sp. NRRL B-16210 TaxID=1463821 RepID=UPI0004BF8710|nr:MaoC family dehydratase [Glycomyces sp. NRRL B-16210]
MSPQVTVPSPAALADAVGSTATSEWFNVDQERIDAFADATGDHQWIHVDPERAKAGPFGGPIAHGYLTLSLLPRLTAGLFEVGRLAMTVNYGLDRLRFLQPVAAGSRVRAVVELASAEPSNLGIRAGYAVTIEIEDADKPALVAQTITLYVPE